jgi:hypothetical protein
MGISEMYYKDGCELQNLEEMYCSFRKMDSRKEDQKDIIQESL